MGKAKRGNPFPLTLHKATGQWCKNLHVATTGKRKLFYFGRDKAAALQKYLDSKDALQAGRDPDTKPEGDTVADVCNKFLNAKREKVDSGDLSERSWVDLQRTCRFITETLTRERIANTLTPADFAKLRSELSKPSKGGQFGTGRGKKRRGPVSLANEIGRIKSVFRWAKAGGCVAESVTFGPDFAKPSKKTLRTANATAGSKMIEADVLRRAIAAAKTPVCAMVLLGINAAMGQSDIAALPMTALDLDGGWVSFPRVKTGISRRAALWPETVLALREAIAARPDAKNPDDAELVFLTKYGSRWVRFDSDTTTGRRTVHDAVGREFARILTAMGEKGRGSFYNLRHTFRTVADEANDGTAIDCVMGHADSSMGANYRQRLPSDARLKVVSDLVRGWLYPSVGPPAAGA